MRFSKVVGHVKISFNSSRIDRNVPRAQEALNKQIVADCDPYVPFSQGGLRDSVRFPEGVYGGKIEYAAPYAHYQYEGTVYGPNLPQYDGAGNIIGWASPPKKYPTKRKLQYHTHGTTGHWLDPAKKAHLKDWKKTVEDAFKEG